MAAENTKVDEKTVNTSGRPTLRRVEAVAVRRAIALVLEMQVGQLHTHRARAALVQRACIVLRNAALGKMHLLNQTSCVSISCATSGTYRREIDMSWRG